MNAWIWVAIIVMAGMAWATYRLGRAAGRENPPMARDYQPQVPNDEAFLEAVHLANEDRQP